MTNKRGVETYQEQFAEWIDGEQVLVTREECKGSHIIAEISANSIISEIIEQGRNI